MREKLRKSRSVIVATWRGAAGSRRSSGLSPPGPDLGLLTVLQLPAGAPPMRCIAPSPNGSLFLHSPDCIPALAHLAGLRRRHFYISVYCNF